MASHKALVVSVGASKVTLSTAGGHKVILDDAGQLVRIEHQSGSVVTLTAAGQVKIEAIAGVDITTPTVQVHAAVANFDGIVRCATLIASSGVISPSYTPGAGNIL